jgi:hypothetical protein
MRATLEINAPNYATSIISAVEAIAALETIALEPALEAGDAAM